MQVSSVRCKATGMHEVTHCRAMPGLLKSGHGRGRRHRHSGRRLPHHCVGRRGSLLRHCFHILESQISMEYGTLHARLVMLEAQKSYINDKGVVYAHLPSDNAESWAILWTESGPNHVPKIAPREA